MPTRRWSSELLWKRSRLNTFARRFFKRRTPTIGNPCSLCLALDTGCATGEKHCRLGPVWSLHFRPRRTLTIKISLLDRLYSTLMKSVLLSPVRALYHHDVPTMWRKTIATSFLATVVSGHLQATSSGCCTLRSQLQQQQRSPILSPTTELTKCIRFPIQWYLC